MSLNTKNNNKGITLIALVITIIVLLILAGVSIATLTGQNGILTKAKDAASQTKAADAKEQVQLAVTGSLDNSGKIVKSELHDKLVNDLKASVDKEATEDFPWDVTLNGQIVTIKADGTVENKGQNTGGGTETTVPPTTAVGSNTEYRDTSSGDKIAVIPKGFKVSDESESTKHIDTGLVIIGPDESQFVWVPVDKTTLCADGTTDKEIAEISSGTDYRGILYKFSGTTSSKRAYSSTEFREPAYLTNSSYADASSYNTIGLTADSLQQEYNAIINSIKTNGGFYVGRYESSISGETIKSVSGEKPMSAATSSGNMWYGMYAKQKVYSTSLNTTHSTNIKSAMIYGSTYDAMLNWALNGNDKSKVTESSNGNHSGSTTTTGNATYSNDKINNIFDLEGNLYEWTAEAYDTYGRVRRGRLLQQQ